VKKTVIIVLAVMMFAAVGCKKSEEPKKAAVPQTAAQSVAPPAAVPPAVPPAGQPSAAPQTPAMQAPAVPPAGGGDPHAGLKLKEMAAGMGHKGKVLQTMEAGSYSYVEVEEKGQKLWLAVMKTAVKKGDIVEFPDSPPMVNFESKTLKKTFDKIIFAEGLRIVK